MSTYDDRADSPPPNHKGAREARYRRELRDTQEAVEAMRSKVRASQRAEAEALAAAHITPAKALWGVTTLDDLLDADGNVDPAQVLDAARRAMADLGARDANRTTSARGLAEAMAVAMGAPRGALFQVATLTEVTTGETGTVDMSAIQTILRTRLNVSPRTPFVPAGQGDPNVTQFDPNHPALKDGW